MREQLAGKEPDCSEQRPGRATSLQTPFHQAGEGRSTSTLCLPCAPQGDHRAASLQGRALAVPPSATFHLQMNISRLVGRQAELGVQLRTLPAAGQGLCSGFPPLFQAGASSRQTQGWLSWWRSRAGCAGGAAEPTQGHGQTLQTVGQMLQQPLALLRHGTFLQDSPTSSPAEPREGRWELLHQPPTPGDARGSALVPTTNQGQGLGVSQRSRGMLTAPEALLPRPGWWDTLRASKPSCPCPPQLQEQREDGELRK